MAYPYAIPGRSFLQLGERTLALPTDYDLGDRQPLLAYGSNAAPEALARKLGAESSTPLPLIRAELSDFDVVYSAHLSPYGAVPATLHPSPGTITDVFVAYPTEEQLRLLSATEPNYARHRFDGISCRAERDEPLDALDAFLSRHGCLLVDGAAVALSAISAHGRTLEAMTEAQVLERVRATLFSELSLAELVAAAVATGGQPLATERCGL
jgi:hypothetical protein